MSDESMQNNTPRHETDRTEDGKIKHSIKPHMVDMTGASPLEPSGAKPRNNNFVNSKSPPRRSSPQRRASPSRRDREVDAFFNKQA